MLDPELCGQPHITIWTRDASVPPFEAGGQAELFKKGWKGSGQRASRGLVCEGEEPRVYLTAKEVQVVPIRLFHPGEFLPIHQSPSHSLEIPKNTVHRFVSLCEALAYRLDVLRVKTKKKEARLESVGPALTSIVMMQPR